MAFDAFKEEKSIIDKGEALISQGMRADFTAEYADLLSDYKKLFKVSKRLVRMSDRSEMGLKGANQRIQEQQAQLEKAHDKLSRHADILEDKVAERTKELTTTQGKLEKLVEIGVKLSSERNRDRFIEMVLRSAKELTNADGGALYMRNADDHLEQKILWIDSIEVQQGGAIDEKVTAPATPLRDAKGHPRYNHPIAHVVLTERVVGVDNVQESTDFDFGDFKNFDKQNNYKTISLLAVPLVPRQGEVIGLILLYNARAKGGGRVTPFSRGAAEFVEALTSQAAVAMDNQNLIEAQQNLFDSIVKLLATAIDTKSPYTGGHCERVPQLGMMLAQSACIEMDGPLADFDMNEDEWNEFRVAGWLHDCGKVTTPEYVVDKATKLETIYNRIHEVRLRFEVMLRDCTIDYQRALTKGDDDPDALRKDHDAKISQLRDDFAFVAECNVGGEFMEPDKIERLESIAAQTWERHFDDRLGLSDGELKRIAKVPSKDLPAVENLLSDKKEHIVPRPKGVGEFDSDFGFKVQVPKHLYNYGEVYNLAVSRGTLTEEERFKINEHMIQTIIMLEQLPFPKNMARIPEYAGGHHETMIGTGYPRNLKRVEMSVQARILAIADIFEALTASDRPYKKPKTLTESLKIMSFMRNDQHIDPDLFDLFLTSGVYSEYAEKFLPSSQIDDVDIAKYVQKPG